jgi:hypothetical protein
VVTSARFASTPARSAPRTAELGYSGSATEIASIGPVTITYAFRSWVLVEAPGESVRRRVRSEHELAVVLAGLGLPQSEAVTVADRLWAARPEDAGLASVRPWEGWAASTGLSRLQLFLLVAAIAAVIGLILWLAS